MHRLQNSFEVIFDHFFVHFKQYLYNNLMITYVYTYIISHYNPSVRITVYHFTTLMLCALILYVSGGTLQFNVASERQIFEKVLHGGFILLAEFLPEICWVEVVAEIFSCCCFDTWSGIRTQARLRRLLKIRTQARLRRLINLMIIDF